ncbi:MAG: hypothetical protein ACREUB_12430 [Burkholderiales bacterium]
MLLVVTLVATSTALLVYGMVDTTSAALRRDRDTAASLAQAKQALIGRAVADGTRPGSLPCPDIDDDGSAESTVAYGGVCPNYIGRLPWRTLGLPDPRDASGERLWYALFPAFRDHSSAGMLDVDTKGGLTVYQDSAATVLTAQAVAVIFAPGPLVAGQIRDSASTNNPANYLDATDGVNNAIAGGPFIGAQTSSTFNDKLLVITTADVMPPLERRVAREMLALLQSYRSLSACACYPWASNDFDDDSVSGRNRGMVPIEFPLPETWGSLGLTVPAWMIGTNEWGKRFYYAVAPDETEDKTGGTLTIDGAARNLVLITTGPADASRPSTNLSDYVDDVVNRDGDNTFQTPSSTAYARDRLYTIP